MKYDMIIPGATCNAKEKPKKTSDIKMNHIDFDNFSQTQVLRWIFEIHGIVDKYEISPAQGPDLSSGTLALGSWFYYHIEYALLITFIQQ